MQAAIAQNPHNKDPKQLWKILDEEDGTSNDDEFDSVGFERLKNKLRSSGNFIVK